MPIRFNAKTVTIPWSKVGDKELDLLRTIDAIGRVSPQFNVLAKPHKVKKG